MGNEKTATYDALHEAAGITACLTEDGVCLIQTASANEHGNIGSADVIEVLDQIIERCSYWRNRLRMPTVPKGVPR